MAATTGVPHAIFIDVDGTLTDHGIIDPTAAEAIRAARAAGHLVFVSTGRAYLEVPPDVLEIGFDGVISNGGSFARLGDEVLLARAMTPQQVARLIKYFERDRIPLFLQTDRKLYGTRAMLDIFDDFWRNLKITRAAELVRLGLTEEAATLDSLSEDVDDRFGLLSDLYRPDGSFSRIGRTEVARAVFIGLADDYDGADDGPLAGADVVARAAAELADEFHVAPGSMPSALGQSGEISPLGVTKGSAIEHMLKHLGIAPEHAVGIGDSWNDLEMFDVCGTAIAMGNAPEEVKARADRVTSPVLQGGVRDALIELGLA